MLNVPNDFIGIDPASLTMAEAYQHLLQCVSPRPIAFVSTVSADGKPNLAPFSFFMAGGGNPPSVIVSPLTDRYGEPKDTLRNIRETGEYTINVVTYAMRERMNVASSDFPPGVSEWTEAGFDTAPGAKVRTPHVADSPLAIECRLHQIVPHGDGYMAANYIIGEVVYFHIARQMLGRDGALDPTRIDYIARMSGDWYDRVTPESMFEMPRPKRVDRYPDG
jgi:flavin reductase (DIM6/NTAB) family NADH-FMN oxidoreductase RutF